MRRGWLWTLLAVLVVGGAGAAWYWRSKTSRPALPQFVTAKVERGGLVGRVTATGTLSALVTVQVGSQVSGRIKSLNADFNSQVKKGQVLAKLDPELFEAALAQSKANTQAAAGNLAKAKAQAADARRKLARTQTLAEQKLVSEADLDAARAELEVAQASVSAAEGSSMQAEAARHQAEVNLTYATVVSPIDGTVISRAVDVGQTVAASLQAPTLFTIAENLARMQVDTNVAEADVGKLADGLEATFTVDAFAHRAFKGRIRQIRYAPQVVSNVVTYDAVIEVDNPELLLRPGMTANVTFIYANVEDALKVPNAALRFRYDGAGPGAGGGNGQRAAGGQVGAAAQGGGGRRDGKSTDRKQLWVLKGGAPTAVAIKTGLSDGSSTQVLEGELAEGDEVIIDKKGGESGRQSPGQSQSMGGMRRMF